MKNKDSKTGPIKKTEVFNRPNPYDLVSLSATFDDCDLQPPPKTYFPAIDVETQIREAVENLKKAYGQDLLFVGLTGSRATGTNRPDADIDIIALISDEAIAEKVSFIGDLKIVSLSGLQEFIEHGYQLVTTQFKKAKPLYERVPGFFQTFEYANPILEKAVPFLLAKTRFNEQTAEIFQQMSRKYRAIFMHTFGHLDAALSVLKRGQHDSLFEELKETHPTDTYGRLAEYYANLGLNRVFHSISESAQLLHISETERIADVEELIQWTLETNPNVGLFYKEAHTKRIECYKQGRILADSEFTALRTKLATINDEVEKRVRNRFKRFLLK